MLKKKSKGHIITISSIAGKFGAPNYSAYCASKHGVTGFKKSLRWELMAKQIKVSTIHPGRIDTEFFDSYKQKPSKAQMLSPKDIAQYVVAIAERSLLKKYYFKLRNLLKRNYNLIKYSLI